MKWFLIISFLFLLFVSFKPLQRFVFVCKGPSSKVYHKSEKCKGLSHCSTQIYKVMEEEAKSIGRRACRIEY